MPCSSTRHGWGSFGRSFARGKRATVCSSCCSPARRLARATRRCGGGHLRRGARRRPMLRSRGSSRPIRPSKSRYDADGGGRERLPRRGRSFHGVRVQSARVAANLDTPVLLIVSGRTHDAAETLGQSTPRTASDIAQVAEIGRHELHAAHASLLAILVNRADPPALERIVTEVSAAGLAGIPVWALPEEIALVSPTVATVLAAVHGRLVRGGSSCSPARCDGSSSRACRWRTCFRASWRAPSW